MKKTQQALPYIAYFNICFFWGTSHVVNKLGASVLHPLLGGTIRFSLVAVLLLGWLLLKKIPLRVPARELYVLGLSGFLMYFLNTLLLLLAARRVDASVTTVVLCLIPVVVVLLDALAQRRFRVGPLAALGIVGGFAGVAVTAGGGFFSGEIDGVGLLELFASVLVWSCGTVFLKRRTVTSPLPVQIFLQAALPAVLFLGITALSGNLRIAELAFTDTLPAVYMGITDSIIGLSSYIYLLRKWDTAVVTTYAYINPVVGLLLSAAILHEAITVEKVAGMAVVLCSVALIQREGRPQKVCGSQRNHL